MIDPKKDRFQRVAVGRANRVIDMLRMLAKCSDPASYSYTQEQIAKMFGEIWKEVDRTQQRFLHPDTAGKFTLGKEESDND